jgi:serine protease AprX
METFASTPISLRGWMGCGARLLVLFLTAMLLSATSADSQAAAQPRTQDKISPDVQRAVAQGATTLQLFIELQDQPQADILRQTEAGSSRLLSAKSNFERLAGYGSAAPVDKLNSARDELDAATSSARHDAAQAIQNQIRFGQDNVSAALSGAGATNIQSYYIVNVLSADVPAAAIATIAKRPEVAQIRLAGWGSGDLNTAANLGAPAFWHATPPSTGVHQNIAILSSGIDEEHPAFKGDTFNEDKVFLANSIAHPICPWGERMPPSANDFSGHGTAIADAVVGKGSAPGPAGVAERGIAYGATEILNVKVEYRCVNPNAPGPRPPGNPPTNFQDADVLMGLQYAVFDARPKLATILNLSMSTDVDDAAAIALQDYVDRVVDLSPGLVVTVSAGNRGKQKGQQIHSPSAAYNAITVAGEQVKNDGELLKLPTDTSSRGPSSDGRRKPDISAPGENLHLASIKFREHGHGDYATDFSGTSYASPQVAGAAALLLDFGVPSEVAVKALLINEAVTANAAPATWDPAPGWGYMRLGSLPGLLQRSDGNPVCVGTPQTYASACVSDIYRNANSVRWYQGSIKGDFKATLVWNRHFTNTSTPAATANPPLDIDKLALTLYHLQGGAYKNVASSATPKDNVQQVHATGNGKVLVKVKLPGSFVTGVSSEPYGLAFSTPLAPVAGPQLVVNCTGPEPAQPMTLVSVACTVTNSGGLPVNATATAPPGTIANNGALGTLAPGDTPFAISVTSPSVTDPAVFVLVTVTGTLAEETFTATTAFFVSDAPQGCPTPTLTPAGPVTVPAAGATYTVMVTGLPVNCKWNLQLSDSIISPWVTSNPPPGPAFPAPGSFTITAAPNTGTPSRVGGAFVNAGPNLNGITPPSAVFQMNQLGAP